MPSSFSTGARRPRILLAEDETAFGQILCSFLEHKGCIVTACADGQAAMESFVADGPFDLVLTDQRMPRLCGVELLAALRARDFTGPVVVLGNLSPAETAAARALAVTYILGKPVSMSELWAALSSVIGTAGSFDLPTT